MSLPFGLEETVRGIVRDELAAQRPAGADGMTLDGGQQLAADGSVTYDFAGHIHAQGLDLDAGINAVPQNDQRVRWLRGDTQALVAYLGGLTFDNNFAEAFMSALSPDAVTEANLLVQAIDASQPTKSRVVAAFVNSGVELDFLIADSTGVSDFLQLAATEKLALDIVDTGTYAINAGAAVGAGGTWTDTYNHALGRVPQFAAAILANGGTVGTNVLVERLATRTTTQLGFAYRFVNGAASGAGATARFLILVIG